MELSVAVFDLSVSLVMLNSILFSFCVGVLLFTWVNVDDGSILDFGTLSLSSGHKPDLLKPDMMLLGFFTKVSPSEELEMLALTLFVALTPCKTFAKFDIKLFWLDYRPQYPVAVRR